jgi:hypothetical protein
MTITCLYDLALNAYVKVPLFYPPDTGVVQTIINKSIIADKALPEEGKSSSPRSVPTIGNAQLLQILTHLLETATKVDPDELNEMKKAFLETVESHLNDANCERLADVQFIIWISSLVKSSYLDLSKYEHNEISSQVFDIINKVVIFDLNRPKKKFMTLSLIRK